jgi:hypothetical protein
MSSKIVLSMLFILVVLSLLILYWFVPFSDTNFFVKPKSSNFSLGNNTQPIQFYENMRFPTSKISYRIDNCPLQKREDMLQALQIISEKTILSFYGVNNNEEIIINCENKNVIEGGLFIAGEGGPTNITKSGEFNVITSGKILLIKESTCQNPNIAIHELLHVLGFDHSEDPNDIMYSISKCDQEINPATIKLINSIYSIPSYPDLVFENVSAIMHGRYLNLNMSIRNNGLQDAPSAKIIVYADNTTIKNLDINPLEIGHGRMISLTNIWISQFSVQNIKLDIVTTFDELKKENNEVLLEVKK